MGKAKVCFGKGASRPWPMGIRAVNQRNKIIYTGSNQITQNRGHSTQDLQSSSEESGKQLHSVCPKDGTGGLHSP